MARLSKAWAWQSHAISRMGRYLYSLALASIKQRIIPLINVPSALANGLRKGLKGRHNLAMGVSPSLHTLQQYLAVWYQPR